MEDLPPSDWECLCSFFLIANWCGRTQSTRGSTIPRQMCRCVRKLPEQEPEDCVPPAPASCSCLSSCPDFPPLPTVTRKCKMKAALILQVAFGHRRVQTLTATLHRHHANVCIIFISVSSAEQEPGFSLKTNTYINSVRCMFHLM